MEKMKIREKPSGALALAYLLVSSAPSPPRDGFVINTDLRSIAINLLLSKVIIGNATLQHLFCKHGKGTTLFMNF